MYPCLLLTSSKTSVFSYSFRQSQCIWSTGILSIFCKKMLPELLEGSSSGTDGTVNDSGWPNSAIFRTYLEEHTKIFNRFFHWTTAEACRMPVTSTELCKHVNSSLTVHWSVIFKKSILELPRLYLWSFFMLTNTWLHRSFK